MEALMAPDTYVAKDGLVEHQWEESPLSCECSVSHCMKMPGQRNRLHTSRHVHKYKAQEVKESQCLPVQSHRGPRRPRAALG